MASTPVSAISGVNVGGWRLDPATGKFVALQPGVPQADPYQYKYELQCHLGGGDFDTDCLAVLVDCKNGPDGKDGIPVVWLKAPAGVPNPTWSLSLRAHVSLRPQT